MNSIFIVIPAYNAEKTIAGVVDRVRRQGFENVVVVDDGSRTPETFKAAEKAGATVLRHIVNRGYGAAIRTGLLYAERKGAKYVITLDADGQHQPEEIKDLLKPLLENKADIVFGSRFLTKQSNVPFMRKLFLKGGIWVIYLFYGLHMTDSHNGFRALNRTALEKMKFSLDRMAHSSEYPSEVRRNKLRYVEVPVTITYTADTLRHGQEGIGSLNAFKILFKMIMQKLMR